VDSIEDPIEKEGLATATLSIDVQSKSGVILDGILNAVPSLEGGGCVALAMATTGIAAMLLEKGQTLHSRMKAPLNPDNTSTLCIPAQSELAKLVKMAKLLVIDEATMLDNRQLVAMDRTLRDVMQCKHPFGGKIMVLAGDMRQCLVVLSGASRAGIVERTVNQCPLWKQFKVIELTRNMHVLTSRDEHLIAWDNLITSIGNSTCGTPMVNGNIVTFPEEMCLKIEQNTAEDKSMIELIKKVFPDLKDNIKDPYWLPGRAILTLTNKAVDAINDIVVATIPGPSQKLHSVDGVDDV
jgi:ATP-dependent DNA helicase PIF1